MKKLENCISYSCYRYAPESFQLCIQGNRIHLDYNTAQNFGCTLLTAGQAELLKAIKQFIRTKTIVRNKEESLLFTIPLQDSDEYIHCNLYVKQYGNIKEHLEIYKDLKRSLEATNYKSPITVTTAELDGNFKAKNVTEQENKIRLSNRIRLLAA